MNQPAYDRLKELEDDMNKCIYVEKLKEKYKAYATDTRQEIEKRIKIQKEYIKQFEEDLINMRFINEHIEKISTA